MQSENILDIIESQVKELMTQKLRSKTTVISRIYPLIVQAQNLGYTHEAINAKTLSGGLQLQLNTYMNSLHRVKKAIESGRIQPTKDLLMALTQQSAIQNSPQASSKILDAIAEKETHVMAEFQETENLVTTSANQIKDTLKESVKVGSNDYSKFAMEKLKSKGKNK